MYSSTCTVPASHTRPRSLRSRSISITCSGALLRMRMQLTRQVLSEDRSWPRRRVPAIGRVVIQPSRTATRRSGDELMIAMSSMIAMPLKGPGLVSRSH